MKEEFRENKENVMLGGILLIMISAASAAFLAINYSVVEQGYFANGTVIAENEAENLTAGIDAGKNLHFGEVTEGTNVTKTININSPQKSVVEVSSRGNISEYLVYDDRKFFEGNESVEVQMATGDPGYFEGNVNLTISVSENRVTDEWLRLRESLQ